LNIFKIFFYVFQNTVNTFSGKIASELAKDLIQSSKTDNCVEAEDEKGFNEECLNGEEVEECVKVEENLNETKISSQSNESSSNGSSVKKRIQYSRDYLLSLRTAVLSPKMRVKLFEICDTFADIFVD
jgi:hypothetical protein